MLPVNPIDDCPDRYPLLYGDIGDIESGGYDLTTLSNGVPARLISVGTAGDLVVVDIHDEEHVIYSEEWTAGPLKWIQVKKVLSVTTDTTKYPSPVSTTAQYVRVYF